MEELFYKKWKLSAYYDVSYQIGNGRKIILMDIGHICSTELNGHVYFIRLKEYYFKGIRSNKLLLKNVFCHFYEKMIIENIFTFYLVKKSFLPICESKFDKNKTIIDV